jgi:long-chain acyl-CoA synthetase
MGYYGFGLSQIGVVSVPVYPSISPEDYEFIFNNAEIQYCFVSDKDLLNKVMKVKHNIPSLQNFYF